MRIKCIFGNCGYEWNCKSKMIMKTCPSCMRKFKPVVIPLSPKKQAFIDAYKAEGIKVYELGVAEFGKEETDFLIDEYIPEYRVKVEVADASAEENDTKPI